MKAAVLTKPHFFSLQETILPPLKADEIKIRVEGCGICASSVPLWEGREWFTYPAEPGSPGHEGWGIVEALGDNVDDVQLGDRVSFLSYHAYAEYDIAAKGSFVKLPQQLSNIPFPGEPLGCAMNVFNRSAITRDDTVAVIGAGFLGALLCQLIKNAGAKLIVISRRQYSLDTARKYGADELIRLTDTWEIAQQVSEITGGGLCTRVIEATGKQEGIDVATQIIGEGGRLIIAGFHQDGLRQVNLQQWNWKGIDVINAHERDPAKYLSGIQQAAVAVSEGILKPAALYTDTISLDDIARGFELTSNRPDGFIKALIQC